MNVRVLIVDDEPPARRRIRRLLADEPALEVVGECGDGFGAIDAVRSLRPDLMFLDVQMPEVDGFDVLAALQEDELPTVVFVTAYDRYALRAFEARALDYLLKPFDRDRFEAVVRRAREHVMQSQRLAPRIAELLDELRTGGRQWLERIPIKEGGRVRILPAVQLDYIEAEGSYARLHFGGESHLLRTTLTSLEAKLDPSRFVRVHRSRIVNVHRVHELEPLFRGEFVLTLGNGVRLTTGRTYHARIREVFHL